MAIDHRRLDRYRRQRSPVQEHVIDEYVGGGLSRRGFIRNASIVGIGLPAISMILQACGSAPSAGGSGAPGQPGATIRVGQIVPTGTINPLVARAAGDIQALSLCGEYLTLVDENFVVQPWLAESWQPNADGSAWTFVIRQGVTFNDGRPMTVDDVVYTFRQQADPKVGVNAASVFAGLLAPDGVEKVDDRHVRFNLQRPVGAWPSIGVSQTTKNLVIVPAGYDFTKYESQFPGTGRFRMVSYRKNVGGTFERNPNYWGTPAVPGRLELSYFADEGALTAALSAGRVDVNDSFTVSGSPQLLNGDFEVVTIKSAAHSQLSMRCDSGPFADKRVRQALALTLDRPGTAQGLFRQYAQVGNDSPFAPVFAATDTGVPQRAKDVDAARALLAQAGVPNGFSCVLAAEQYAEIPQFAQIVKQSAAAIGIDISLSVQSQTVFRGQSTFGQSPWLDSTMSLISWGDRGVPNIYLQSALQTSDPKTGAGTFNAAHFSNPEFDALTNQFVGAVDIGVQKQLAGRIETLLLDETPVVFAYFQQPLTASHKSVQGAARIPFFPVYWNMAKSA